MQKEHEEIKFYSQFNEKIKNDLGVLFYDMLSEILSDQDLRLMLKVLNDEKETNNGINNQIKETVKNVAFTVMLLYGEDISIKKKENENNKDELIALLDSIDQSNQNDLNEFVDGVYEIYSSIRNSSLWTAVKARLSGEYKPQYMYSRILQYPPKRETYYKFLVEKEIIKENFLISYVKKQITKLELEKLCLREKETQHEKIKSIKDYLEKHLF